MRALLLCLAVAATAACGRSDGERNMSVDEVAKEMSSLKIEPGQWEMVSEIVSVDSPGMPPEALRQMVGRKTTVNNCVTPEQAAKPNANFLAAQKNGDCRYQDFSMDGGVMRGTMSCSGGEAGGRMTMKMNGTYTASSYKMDSEMDAEMSKDMAMKIKAHVVGRRTGDCA